MRLSDPMEIVDNDVTLASKRRRFLVFGFFSLFLMDFKIFLALDFSIKVFF